MMPARQLRPGQVFLVRAFSSNGKFDHPSPQEQMTMSSGFKPPRFEMDPTDLYDHDSCVRMDPASSSSRRFILNEPKKLHALDIDMIRKLYPMLYNYDNSNAVKCLVLSSEGHKGFCAGGDIKTLHGTRTEPGQHTAEQRQFFWEEYNLNHLIHSLSTTHIAIMDGITMGGGVGLSVHGPIRVATENTRFAMPETSIGLFPDVGGSFFLPRLPGSIGTFLALTGHNCDVLDCMYSGVATHMMKASALPSLYGQLESVSNPDYGILSNVLEEFTDCPSQYETSKLEINREAIERCFNASEMSVEAMIAACKAEGTPWGDKQASKLSAMSPTSLKVTLEQLRRGKTMSFADCMRMEYRMALRFMQGSDFFEGVDAKLVRKDNAPAWSPASLPEVTDDMVSAYFAPLEDTHELKLEVPPWMVRRGETGPVPWLSFEDRLLRDVMLELGQKMIKNGTYVDYIDLYSSLDQHAHFDIAYDEFAQDAHRTWAPHGAMISNGTKENEGDFNESHLEPGVPKQQSAFPYSGEAGFDWWNARKLKQPDFAHPIPPV